MKKRNILIAAMILLALGVLPACNIIEECATCEFVQEYSDGTPTSYGIPQPFCGDALAEKENTPPFTVNGVTQYWNCY